MHDRFKQTDTAIQEWMARHEWGVTDLHFDFNREVLAWRHAELGAPSITLRVGRQVMEAWEASKPAVPAQFLDRAGVAAMLEKDHNVLVRRNAKGTISAVVETF